MTLPRNLAFFEVDPPVYENRLASRWRDLHVVDQTVITTVFSPGDRAGPIDLSFW